MKAENILRYTLRINRNLFKKFRYVAEYNGRSANKEIEQLMRIRVENFENNHGKIELHNNEDLTIWSHMKYKK